MRIIKSRYYFYFTIYGYFTLNTNSKNLVTHVYYYDFKDNKTYYADNGKEFNIKSYIDKTFKRNYFEIINKIKSIHRENELMKLLK